MKKIHYVYFDGTSAFVDDETGATDETEVLFQSSDIHACDEFCDAYNALI